MLPLLCDLATIYKDKAFKLFRLLGGLCCTHICIFQMLLECDFLSLYGCEVEPHFLA